MIFIFAFMDFFLFQFIPLSVRLLKIWIIVHDFFSRTRTRYRRHISSRSRGLLTLLLASRKGRLSISWGAFRKDARTFRHKWLCGSYTRIVPRVELQLQAHQEKVIPTYRLGYERLRWSLNEEPKISSVNFERNLELVEYTLIYVCCEFIKRRKDDLSDPYCVSGPS